MSKLADRWMELFQDKRDNKEEWWIRKQQLYKRRQAKIVRIQGSGHVYQTLRYDQITTYYYFLFLSFFIKQNDHYYLEEQVIQYEFQLLNGEISNHKETLKPINIRKKVPSLNTNTTRLQSKQRFEYDRIAAVKYAEYWWNSYNPDFRNFQVDCTNFISQCLLAGGAPMRGAPIRDQGWWYNEQNWSYSWAVAHSLRWYLSGSRTGLKGREVQLASDLKLGDVICYDFQGDGRWDHNTIVVAKDGEDMPLVNAHTDNSRHRYWSYEDSTAWTPNIQYKFFRIGES